MFFFIAFRSLSWVLWTRCALGWVCLPPKVPFCWLSLGVFSLTQGGSQRPRPTQNAAFCFLQSHTVKIWRPSGPHGQNNMTQNNGMLGPLSGSALSSTVVFLQNLIFCLHMFLMFSFFYFPFCICFRFFHFSCFCILALFSKKLYIF